MVRNVHLVVTAVIVVALFVLLIYPAVFPVNAPPVLKTLRDLFLGFAVLALTTLFSLTALVNALFSGRQIAQAIPAEPDLSLYCIIRC
jgi:predicted cation transporter